MQYRETGPSPCVGIAPTGCRTPLFLFCFFSYSFSCKGRFGESGFSMQIVLIAFLVSQHLESNCCFVSGISCHPPVFLDSVRISSKEAGLCSASYSVQRLIRLFILSDMAMPPLCGSDWLSALGLLPVKEDSSSNCQNWYMSLCIVAFPRKSLGAI